MKKSTIENEKKMDKTFDKKESKKEGKVLLRCAPIDLKGRNRACITWTKKRP